MLAWPPIREVRTGVTPEYPDVVPLVLRYSPSLVCQRVADTVEALEGWELKPGYRERIDMTPGETFGEMNEATICETLVVEAITVSSVWGFVDDVTVTIEPYGAGSLVHVHSRSRSGFGDFGQNARNIETLLSALEDQLTTARHVSQTR